MSHKMGLKSVRLSAAEREALAAKLLQQFHARFPLVRISALRPVAQKSDFSSLELVVGIAPESAQFASVKTALLTEICTGESASPRTNSRLYMQHGAHQVEVEFADPAHFDMTVDHLAYQELGRLVSKFVHVQGMSLSGRGLFYRVRDGERMVADIELANSWSHALAILGYDHARWNQGFKSLFDVFEFITSSPLFLAKCFAVKPSEPGSRQALRFVFADWLEHEVLPAPVADPLQWLFARVPGFEARYKAVVAANKKRRK
jgi:hypothetical protein